MPLKNDVNVPKIFIVIIRHTDLHYGTRIYLHIASSFVNELNVLEFLKFFYAFW